MLRSESKLPLVGATRKDTLFRERAVQGEQEQIITGSGYGF
jgi:hypothetical protein